MSPQPNEYRNFYESSKIAFFRTAISDGQFLMTNQACATLLGHDSVEDLLEDKSIHFYVNGDRQHILDELHDKSEVHNYKAELIKKNGEHIWVSITAWADFEKGYMEGHMTDVTSEKKFEEKVSIESERLGELTKGMKAKIKELSVSLPSLNTASKRK